MVRTDFIDMAMWIWPARDFSIQHNLIAMVSQPGEAIWNEDDSVTSKLFGYCLFNFVLCLWQQAAEFFIHCNTYFFYLFSLFCRARSGVRYWPVTAYPKILVCQYICGEANHASFLVFLNWASCFMGIWYREKSATKSLRDAWLRFNDFTTRVSCSHRRMPGICIAHSNKCRSSSWEPNVTPEQSSRTINSYLIFEGPLMAQTV